MRTNTYFCKRSTILAEGKSNTLRRAAIWGIFVTFIPATLYIMAMAGAVDLLTAVTVIIFLIYPLSVYVIYQQTRTLIKVSDLLQGRTFPCKSVVGLLVKEKEVIEMTLAFRHLLEALKNWRTREIVKLEPYISSTMPMIESSHENT